MTLEPLLYTGQMSLGIHHRNSLPLVGTTHPGTFWPFLARALARARLPGRDVLRRRPGCTLRLLGPVVSSFRALSRRLKLTVRRHNFNEDSRHSADGSRVRIGLELEGLVTCCLSHSKGS